jgi:hypothetical protein
VGKKYSLNINNDYSFWYWSRMKLVELLEVQDNVYTRRFTGKDLKIKRPEVINKGNDKIVYLGTDAIQRSHSGPQAYPLGPKGAVPKIDRKKLKIKRVGRVSKKTNGETLWLDNPTCTPSSTSGY